MIKYKFIEDRIIDSMTINSTLEMVAPFYFDMEFRTPLNGEEVAIWVVNFWNEIEDKKTNVKNKIFRAPFPDGGAAFTSSDLRDKFFEVAPELYGAEQLVS
jgi:hypothetical protein